MDVFTDAVVAAFAMITDLDGELVEVIGLSLQVSLSALVISSIIGLPVGAVLALSRFPGRQVTGVIINALLGLPPVVVGLAVYLLLSRSGPFGVFGLLFTPTAMVIAQTILVTPIIASLARESLASLNEEYDQTLKSMRCSPLQRLVITLQDSRMTLATAHLAGFGRAISEVGAVMIVGGNIDHVTRVMTTSIALEVSKGDLSLALALGLVLILISLLVNALVYLIRSWSEAGTP